MIITHHVDPLTVCMHEGPTPPCAYKRGGTSLERFRDAIARDMTCEECDTYIRGIKNHLTGEENIQRYYVLGFFFCNFRHLASNFAKLDS